MTETQLCPVCKNPKRSSSFGSLTQWIVACNCDLRDGDIPEEDAELSISICRECGKRLGEGRAGSFTQFIFRSDVCRCQVPKVLKSAIESAPVIEPVEFVTEDENEIALPLSNDSFPTERYKPLSELGTGAGGAVYLARDLVLNKRVAVKMLHLIDKKLLVAFQDEARATSKLKHPSIVGVIDFGLTKNEIPYMVLDYFNGIALNDLLEREGSLDWPVVQNIFAQVCDALAYAHNNGVYHRDIKPSNLLMATRENGSIDVRIIDFGIAKVEGDSHDNKEYQRTTVVGAPLYMSPDSGLGVQYDSRSETYSLGCVIFEALTGSPPFRGETAIQTLSMHAHEKTPLMVEVNPDKYFPEEVEELVKKALSKNPADRFQNMSEMGQAIRNIDIDPDQVAPLTAEKKSPLAVALKNMVIVGLLAITIWELAQVTFLAPPPPVSKVEKEKAKAAEKKAEEFRQNKKEIEELKTDEILTTLNLTGGKWNRTGSELEGHEVTDEDFKTIKDIATIKSVKVTVESKVTGEGLKYIVGAPLTHAWIMSSDFNDNGAAQLCKFPKIKRLTFHYDNRMTPDGLRKLMESLHEVESVHLRFMMLKPGMVEAILPGKSVRTVDLGHSQNLTLDDMRELTKIKKLVSLTVTNTGIDDEAIKVLTSIPTLLHLDIGETSVTDNGLMMIAEKMPQLLTVKVSVGDGITSIGVKKFNKKLPSCALEVSDGLNPLQLLDIK